MTKPKVILTHPLFGEYEYDSVITYNTANCPVHITVYIDNNYYEIKNALFHNAREFDNEANIKANFQDNENYIITTCGLHSLNESSETSLTLKFNIANMHYDLPVNENYDTFLIEYEVLDLPIDNFTNINFKLPNCNFELISKVNKLSYKSFTNPTVTSILKFNMRDKLSNHKKYNDIVSKFCLLASWATNKRVQYGVKRIYTESNSADMFFYNGVIHNISRKSTIPRIHNKKCNNNFKNFIECAYKTISSDSEDWFWLTINYSIESVQNTFCDVSCSILNTLLDRISSKVCGKISTAVIDDNLKTNFKSNNFVTKMTEFMKTFTNSWSESRSEAIKNTILMWNSSLAFAAKIQKCCEILNIPVPAKSFVSKRHKFLHEGEFTDPNDGTLSEYYIELEALVTIMILSLLKFKGYFYHSHYGSKELLLSDVN